MFICVGLPHFWTELTSSKRSTLQSNTYRRYLLILGALIYSEKPQNSPSCQKTASSWQLPFLFFQVQLFQVLCRATPCPWTVEVKTKQQRTLWQNIKRCRPKCRAALVSAGWTMESVMQQTFRYNSKWEVEGDLFTFLRSHFPCFIDIAAWGRFLEERQLF